MLVVVLDLSNAFDVYGWLVLWWFSVSQDGGTFGLLGVRADLWAIDTG